MTPTEKTKYRVLEHMGWGLSIVAAADDGRVMLRREYEKAGYWHTRWRADAYERAEPVMFHRHPSVAAIYEFGDEKDESYTLQEPVYGITLRTLSLGRRLPVERVVCVATCLCDAVGSLHGVTPCVDLAPHHVMLSVDGHVKLIGREEKFLECSGTVSRSEVIVNRLLPYLSPERLRGMAPGGGGAGDARSDVYSLGVSLWTWLVGENPHELGLDPRSQMPVIYRIARRGQAGEPPVPSPRALRPDVPAWLDEVVMRAMSPDPADRYQTMQQMGEAILVGSGRKDEEA
jgi:serine/threonine protein kinase